MGASKGVVRRLPVGKELIYDYIPVDVVVNELLVAGFHAGKYLLLLFSLEKCLLKGYYFILI